MKLLIVYGGFGLSQEANISELSGREIATAAKTAGFEVTEFRLTQDNLEELKSQLKNFDVVFPVLHGKFGEDGEIQVLLEEAGVKYVGSNAVASRMCFNKPSTQTQLKSADILIPEFHMITSPAEFSDAWLPCVIKPPQGGSSLDTFVWQTADLNQLTELLSKYNLLMVEQYVQGRELTVGILGEAALPIIEIIPPAGSWFDYDNKYSGKSQEIVNPDLPTEIIQQVQTAALKAHQTCGCRHLSRVDFILLGNQCFCLEINTLPGFTRESLYPKAAQAAGYDLPALVTKLIELAL
jgi:D-alanine-D-alanine ligase